VFVLYGLLGGASPPFSHEILLRELTQFFSGDERQAVRMIEFLTAIPGALVFDPQQNDIVA